MELCEDLEEISQWKLLKIVMVIKFHGDEEEWRMLSEAERRRVTPSKVEISRMKPNETEWNRMKLSEIQSKKGRIQTDRQACGLPLKGFIL